MWDFGKIEIPLTEPKATTSLRTIVIHRVKEDVGFGRSNNSHTSGCVGADNRLTDYYVHLCDNNVHVHAACHIIIET